jgi:hypothetical protein
VSAMSDFEVRIAALEAKILTLEVCLTKMTSSCVGLLQANAAAIHAQVAGHDQSAALVRQNKALADVIALLMDPADAT